MDRLTALLVLAVVNGTAGSAMADPTEHGSRSDPLAGEAPARAEATPAAAGARERARHKGPPLALGAGPVTCPLEPSPESPGGPVPKFPEVVKGLPPGRKLWVVVGDLRTNEPPGVTYNVYLNLPEGASPAESQEHFVGSVNFFNATVSSDPAKAPKSDRFVTLDATRVARNLATGGKLKARPAVTIVPDEPPAPGSTPFVGRVEIVER